jgi:hypothetical protein
VGEKPMGSEHCKASRVSHESSFEVHHQ